MQYSNISNHTKPFKISKLLTTRPQIQNSWPKERFLVLVGWRKSVSSAAFAEIRNPYPIRIAITTTTPKNHLAKVADQKQLMSVKE